MVRKYVRKSTRGSGYSKDDLKTAVDIVKSGQMSVYRASLTYHIPKNTLSDHIKGRRGQKSSTYGRRTDLSFEQEKSLADCITCMEKWGFGLTRKEILDIVGNYVKANNIKTQFKNDKPGEDWFLNFKLRHNLSIKTPQSVEFARKKSVDPFLIYEYFDLLEDTIKELGLENKPSQIWNLDESSFCADPSKAKIVGQRGKPSTRTTSGPGKQNTTVLMACSASGEKAPPLIIFKGKHVWDQWLAPVGSEFPEMTYAATTNGWMESTVFMNYFEKSFIKHLGMERPVLVIYDGHTTHLSVEVVKCAIENQITILKLPPHTSHILQPLDLSVFKSLKTRWDAKLVGWQRKNVGEKIPKSTFSKFIALLWKETNPEIVRSGFMKGGIFPLNRNVVSTDSFDPVSYKKWKSTLSNPNTSVHADASEAGPSSNQILESPPKSPTSNTTFEQQKECSISFQELLLQTVKRDHTPMKQPRKRICTGAEVITQKDVNLLKQKQIDNSKVKKKSNLKKKKNRKSESSSESDEMKSWKSDKSYDRITEFDEFSESENEHSQEQNDTECRDEILKIQKGDFVLANFFGKKKSYKYVCLVTNVLEDEVEVTCLRKLHNRFEFRLDENDKCSVLLSDIEHILEQPKLIPHGSFQKYVFTNEVGVSEL